jgi:hypothetical protein
MIEFAIHAADEDTFWASWIAAGIASAPYMITSDYSNSLQLSTQSQQGWAPTDSDGNTVAGWHANVRVSGPLEVRFTAGLPADGSLWERTHAVAVFGLEFVGADPVTLFKAGYRSVNFPSVRYADIAAWATPTNVWC